MTNKKKRMSQVELIRQQFMDRLVAIAESVFTWTLPKGCSSWFLERTLLFQGTACVSFIPEIDDWVTSAYTPTSKYPGYDIVQEIIKPIHTLDIQLYEQNMSSVDSFIDNNGVFDFYGNPKGAFCFGVNGTCWKPSSFCIVWDNYNRKPLVRSIMMYSDMLTAVWCTMTNNLRQQNTPFLVQCPTNMTDKLQAFFDSYFSFSPVVSVRAGNDIDLIKVSPLTTQYMGDKLMDLYLSIWKEALNTFGVSSSREKRERLITAEAAQDREGDRITLASRLLPRMDAVKYLNSNFNLGVKVEMSQYVRTAEEELKFLLEEAEGGLLDGKLQREPTGNSSEE